MLKRSVRLFLMLGIVLTLSITFWGCGGGGDGAAIGGGGDGGGGDGAVIPIDDSAEACGVCHAENRIADVVVAHAADYSKKSIATNIVVTSGAGATDSVTFDVFEDGGTTAITGLTMSNMRFYMADILPAGVATTTTYVDTVNPVLTWDTPYLARWLYERTGSNYDTGVLTDNGGGSYTYDFVADLALGNTVVVAPDLAPAPDFNLAHTQRLLIRVDTRSLLINRGIGLVDFIIPADGASSSEVGVTREIVNKSACISCHNDPLENAAHGGGYQSPQSCNICHTPIGNTYGDRMQNHEAWAASLYHKLHSAIPMDEFSNRINGAGYAAVRFPGDVKNCETCHVDQGQDMAAAWKTNPTKEVCTTCHTTVDLTGGAVYTGISGDDKTGHMIFDDNTYCKVCHSATGAAIPTDIVTAHATTARTMAATITGAAVSPTTGNVSVTFTMVKGVTPVTNQADFTSFAFTLAKLVPGVGGGSVNWVSYTARARTKDAAQPPVIQGYSENTGTLTDDGAGVFTYTFALPNANIDGDIRSHMNDAVNVSTVDGEFNKDMVATYPNVVTYDATLTHRVGMEFKEADGTRNMTNATFDFVPDGSALTTRDIVTIDTCNNCHGGVRLHKGYDVEYCVTCHNQSTFDPFSGDSPVTVDLQTIVHKLHMGADLPSVIDGGTYTINRSHDYSNLVLPQSASNCNACHDETNVDGQNWRKKQTSRACITCHDSEAAKAHSVQNGGVKQ